MTTLFSDNFGSGNFNAWTSVSSDGTTPSTDNTNAFDGLHATFTTGGVEGYASASKSNLTSSSVCYVRAYYRFVSGLPSSDGDIIIFGGLVSNDYNYGAFIRITRASGQLYWGIDHWENGIEQATYEVSPSNPTTDQWYCVEIKRDVASDTMQLWVDGTSKVSVSRSISGNTNEAQIGCGWKSYSTPATMYVDSVIVDTSYIGPVTSALVYIAGESQTVTAGSVSSVITVQVQDANGNPVTTGATVSLSTTSSGGSFYSDSGGNTQITSIVISSGQSSGNLYYKDTTTGTPTLTASSTGLTSATTQFTISSSGQITHNDIIDWSTATSAFLTTVTPSNLTGSGYIPSNWIVVGSQVSGNINGNAASITGTIPWSKVTSAPNFLTTVAPSNLSGSGDIASGWTVPWNRITNAPSFVTSGSTVTFAGVAISGTISGTVGGVLPVFGSLSASGAISAVINILDDGSGNSTFHNISASNIIESKENFYVPGTYQAWLDYMAQDDEGITPFPETTGKFRVSDITYGQGGYATDLVGGLWKTENGFPQTSPFFLTRHHLAVKKDFFCKGQVVSMEGCLTMYGGYAGWIKNANGFNTWNPIVYLAMSEGSPNYDANHPRNCLEIRTANHGYGGLICNIVSAKGYTNFDWSCTSPSRITNTSYANSSGKTIVVYLSFDVNGAGTYNYAYVSAYVDGNVLLRTGNAVDKSPHTMTFMVPHGKEYSLYDPSGFVSNLQWKEVTL